MQTNQSTGSYDSRSLHDCQLWIETHPLMLEGFHSVLSSCLSWWMVHCRDPESEGINAMLSLSGINPGIVHLLPRSAWALYDRHDVATRDLFKSTLVLVRHIMRRGFCPCSFIAATVCTTAEPMWVCVCVWYCRCEVVFCTWGFCNSNARIVTREK